MPLEPVITKLEDVAEPLREYYKPLEAGGFQLDTSDPQRTSEFRTSNINLLKKNEGLAADLKARDEKLKGFEGLDPERIRRGQEALARMSNDEDAKLIEEGKIDEVVQRRMKTAIADFDEKLAAKGTAYDLVTKERDELRTHVNQGRLRDTVEAAVAKTGIRVREGAMPDLMGRVQGTFKIGEDGTPVVRDSANAFGATGDPLTPVEFIGSLANKGATHLFEASGGGGSEGGRRVVGAKGVRIIDPDNPLAIGKALDDIAAGTAEIGKVQRGR